MKIKRYSVEEKFENEETDWVEMYPEFGSSDWTEKNYVEVFHLPVRSEAEFPSLIVYEKLDSSAPATLPDFLAIFTSNFSCQEVVLEGIVDVIDMINSMLPLFSRIEHECDLKVMNKDFKKMHQKLNDLHSD